MKKNSTVTVCIVASVVLFGIGLGLTMSSLAANSHNKESFFDTEYFEMEIDGETVYLWKDQDDFVYLDADGVEPFIAPSGGVYKYVCLDGVETLQDSGEWMVRCK